MNKIKIKKMKKINNIAPVGLIDPKSNKILLSKYIIMMKSKNN